MSLGMQMMIDSLLKSLKIDPEIIKKQVVEFYQTMTGIHNELLAARDRDEKIMRELAVIREHLGITNDENAVIDFPARSRSEN